MKRNINNFATPDWESTSFGDEMCSNLFKGNERKSNKLKKRLNPRGGIQKTGGILKSNIQKKKILMKDKVLENVGKCIIKVKKMEKRDKSKGKSASVKFSHGEQISKKDFTQSKKLLPKLKYLSNEVGKNIKRKYDPEMKPFLSSSIDTSTPNVDISKTDNASIVNTKNKPSRKKSDILKKHIEKQSETDIKKNKRNTKEHPRNSKIVKNMSKVSAIIQKINKNTSNEESDGAYLFGISSKNSRKNKKCKSLRTRMMEKLKTSRFRYLNEEIYNMNSKDAQTMFTDDPESFKAYHEGYRLQVNSWPINPVDVIIKKIKQMSKTYIIADFGCGEAKLSREVDQKVHSFDLVATNELVTASDMANVPLKKNSVDVVTFCLSLMGTNIHDYLKEANRVLKVGGILMVAEVESRFDDVDNFIDGVHRFGYQNTLKDLSHDFFYFIDFKKISNIKKTRILPTLSLHPCLYKRR